MMKLRAFMQVRSCTEHFSSEACAGPLQADAQAAVLRSVRREQRDFLKVFEYTSTRTKGGAAADESEERWLTSASPDW
jgi:hypothetical protein